MHIKLRVCYVPRLYDSRVYKAYIILVIACTINRGVAARTLHSSWWLYRGRHLGCTAIRSLRRSYTKDEGSVSEDFEQMFISNVLGSYPCSHFQYVGFCGGVDK